MTGDDRKDHVRLDECRCPSPARDFIGFVLPDGAKITLVTCEKCGQAVSWEYPSKGVDLSKVELAQLEERADGRSLGETLSERWGLDG